MINPIQSFSPSPAHDAENDATTRGIGADYFHAFDHVVPPATPPMSTRRRALWQVLAVFTAALGFWYLEWRWTASLNQEALAFSLFVVSAETFMLLGTLLYFFDTWEEGDTPASPAPPDAGSAGLTGVDVPSVDVFVTTYDEDLAVLRATLADAQNVRVPRGWQMLIHVLDDGNRPHLRQLARDAGVNYIARETNIGFKAGNMRNALFLTEGDFIVVCDADTRLFPSFLENTLGYFREADVAWVQTPHWFYDIPQGQLWSETVPHWARPFAPIVEWVTGHTHRGTDPFLSGSMLFFDVIQRRRNRNGASFCCGAGSIHRREPLFEIALRHHRADRAELAKLNPETGSKGRSWTARLVPIQPFRFHVSEDIYTSMLVHSCRGDRWRSVYHPRIECKMLSPWSMDAWAAQKLKYAGGTIDLMVRANPVLSAGMNWRTKLHYAATFWSYLSAFVLLALLIAPMITLVTGIAPVAAYSTTFFLHLLPLLLVNEAALAVGSNKQDANQGRILALATLPMTLRAFLLVAGGRKVRFRPTPKVPVFRGALRFVWPHIVLLGVMLAAGFYGLWAHLQGSKEHSAALLIVNYFWLGWCALALLRAVSAALWRPVGVRNSRVTFTQSIKGTNLEEISHGQSARS